MSALKFETVKHKKGTFIYIINEKQLYGVKKAGKKATAYRCTTRSCNSRIKISKDGKTCTRIKESRLHNHANNAEIKYLELKARIGLENDEINSIKNAVEVYAHDLPKINIAENSSKIDKSDSPNMESENNIQVLIDTNDINNSANIINKEQVINCEEKNVKTDTILPVSDLNKELPSISSSVFTPTLLANNDIVKNTMNISSNAAIEKDSNMMCLETVEPTLYCKTVAFPNKLKIYKKYQPSIEMREIKICDKCSSPGIKILFLPCKHKFCIGCAHKSTKKFQKYLINDLGLSKKAAATISSACFKCKLHIREKCKIFT